MRRIRFLPAILLVLMMTATSGCTVPQNMEPYTAEFPYDPQQYMLFLNKEVQGITNHLMTCIMAVSKSASEEYSAEHALTNIQNCLAMVWEAQEAVKAMRPPTAYTKTKDTILEAIQEIETHCLVCTEELQEEPLDSKRLLELAEMLQGDLISLTSSVHAYWK